VADTKLPYWDIEDIIDELIARLKDATHGINATITAMNTAKSAKDTAASRVVMVLDKFIDVAGTETLTEGQNLFFFMLEEITNCDPIICVRIPLWETDPMGSSTVKVAFQIVLEDKSDGTDPKRKLLRYVTALRAVLMGYVADCTMAQASRLSDVAPDLEQVYVNDVSRSYYSAGVSVELTFA
jgi:hypothetical protein